MAPEAYEDWSSIYNDEIETIWKEERVELRKVSMLYSAFQLELNGLKTNLSDQIMKIRCDLKKRDLLKKCKNFRGLVQSEKYVETVNQENKIPSKLPLKKVDLNEAKCEGLFAESPDKSSDDFTSSAPVSPNKINTSPVLNKNLVNNYKRKFLNSPPCIQPAVTPKVVENSKDNCDDSAILECSLIEGTPIFKTNRRPKTASRSVNKKTKFNKPKPSSTLTQMFMKPQKKKEIDSNLPSMSINAMLELINKSSSETNSDIEINETEDLTLDNLDGAKGNGPKKGDSLVTFVQKYNKLPEKKREIPKFVYNEVVRGKERKQLKGWSCKDCENYYKNLNLSPDELERKMDKCSKHRNKFKPPDDTYDGFWNLTFGPTPQTPESEKSIVFNYKR